MSNFETLTNKKAFTAPQEQGFTPILEEPLLAADEERERYLKQLHRYFINGQKTAESLSVNALPVVLASYPSTEETFAITPFQVLNLQLKKRAKQQLAFLEQLKKYISGLSEILQLHHSRADDAPSNFAFAQELISFDKITALTSSGNRSRLSDARGKRLRQCLQTLTEAYQAYSGRNSIVFTTQKVADKFDLPNQLDEATIDLVPGNPCEKAKRYFEEEIQVFVQIIAALRLAELEVNYEYDESLHGPYFEGFDRSYLSGEDIRHFRPLIVVDESRQLIQQTNAFLSMLSDGDFIRILAINRLDEIEVAINNAHLELAALAIFRRNAYVFQGSMDQTDALGKSFQKGLELPCPTLWNILAPQTGNVASHIDLLALKAGVESRFFPRLEYDFQAGDNFGGHFDISGNPQPEQPFPSYELEIKSPSGNTVQSYVLTAADFLALSPKFQKALEIVPPQYGHEQLVPLAEYLTLTPESATGKIPFIWLVDEQHVLRRAAIPISWLRCCQSRLDYWRFIQESGGVRSQQGIQQSESEWETDKAAAEDLEKQLRTEFDRTREQDLEQAIKRILYALLDTDLKIEDILNQTGTPSPLLSKEVEAAQSSTVQEEKVEQKAQQSPASSEAWIESDLCTSCSDCINALPGVFKYNDDKLAYVHDPKGGSYAKIVAAAEKCPALCIHPGLPQDTSEPGLEKLIKRAEKYN